ncbi:MAG TPA: DUF4476 domain-containing protein [Flavobacteriales bacterium]|nr:DUF4476 domain-containing protein [Flavobacteriales bacterium]
MKIKLLLSVFSILLNLGLFAQLSPCNQAVSSMQFQQVKRDLNLMQAQNQRYTYVDGFVRGECFTTYQLIELLGYISEENDRLSLAMAAYPRLLNKQDVYDIYNSFAYFSSAFRLHDYIATSQKPVTVVPSNPIPPKPLEINFPVLNYPDAANYNGPKNCVTSLSDNDFMMFVREIATHKSEQEKNEAALSLATRTCLTTSQSMKLATALNIENNRLELLKKAYLRVYDEANFDFATQVFTHVPNQAALKEFLVVSRKNAQAQLPPPPCIVNDNDFRTIKEPLANESSSSTRLTIARQQIPRFNCYKSRQIKELVALFSSSTDKLILSKFAYDYVSDKENYFFEISPLLPASSDRQSLSTYIASKR